ncbi:MAG: hydantoinase/oxoprolinase family protein [Pseudomonadota bacterium]
MRLGIDVGGTNTDIAIIDGDRIVGAYKTATRENPGAGVKAVIEKALSETEIERDEIDAVVIGTTHFTNAFVERKKLAPSAILRLCLPSNQDLKPMLDWPGELKQALGEHIYLAHGGYEIDGREAAPMDELQIRKAARDMRKKGVKNIAISSIFSTIKDDMEIAARDLILEEIPGSSVSLSSRLGGLGLIDRENAALINASLRDIGQILANTIVVALRELRISAPFYFSQNDGALMSAKYAVRHPALTFSSGAANSIRGAARLANFDNAIVVDIGGTTTDVGVLKDGFPRELSLPGELGGVRTNLRMPDLYSIGLGGGGIVQFGEAVKVGPQSVGHQLEKKALVFGGEVVTATDIAVAAGRAKIGDPALVANLPAKDVARADQLIQRMIVDAIDRVRTSSELLPVIFAGGGRILAAQKMRGVGEIFVPDYADVANAVGAAFAQVSGAAERIVDYNRIARDDAITDVKSKARDEAIHAGADPSTIRDVEVEEAALPYATGQMMRVRVKVLGELLINGHA